MAYREVFWGGNRPAWMGSGKRVSTIGVCAMKTAERPSD